MLKRILGFQTYFYSTKYQKTISKNCFLKPFLKTVSKQTLNNQDYQKNEKNDKNFIFKFFYLIMLKNDLKKV